MGFIRRFSSYPGNNVIAQIEGINIIDLPPPGSIQGVGEGTVALVGEFADVSLAVTVSASGVVSTLTQPYQVSSAQDLLNNFGGFDETLGDTGISGGNGFIALRNKSFASLVVVAVNNASAQGVRFYRHLPTNASSTNPTPAQFLQSAQIAAGRQFLSGVNRVRCAKLVTFTALGQYASGIDGAVTSSSPAENIVFGSAGGAFLTAKNGGPVQAGDLIVIGVIGGAGALGANALTLRVEANASSNTQLSVEKLDGSNFDWTTTTALPWRLHPASDADTGLQNPLSAAGGFLIPARPLDATVAANSILAPSLVPPVETATSWDPLSGLAMALGASGITYTASVQAPNAASAAGLDALYVNALTSLLATTDPADLVNIVYTARHSLAIRNALNTHVSLQSGNGIGRTAPTSPELTIVTTAAVVAGSDPGVGANRNERLDYNWPGVQTFIPEAVGFAMKGADGLLYTNGMIDVHLDGWMAAVLSNLAPERNPGQAADPVATVLSPILGLQRNAPTLMMQDYITLKAAGIAALRIDKKVGPVFQSGVTTSLVSGQTSIQRRRMADFLEDSIADALDPLSKLPLTQGFKDSVVSEIDSFLDGLKSPNNPPASRINDYNVDDVSGNTTAGLAAGIFVVIVNVQLTPTADFIVLQFNVGNNVVIHSSI